MNLFRGLAKAQPRTGETQGWYDDGWASARVVVTFDPPQGRLLAIEVELPDRAPIERQTISLICEGRVFGSETFAKGCFVIPVMPPRSSWAVPITITLRARTSYRLAGDEHTGSAARQVAYILRSFDYET